MGSSAYLQQRFYFRLQYNEHNCRIDCRLCVLFGSTYYMLQSVARIQIYTSVDEFTMPHSVVYGLFLAVTGLISDFEIVDKAPINLH